MINLNNVFEMGYMIIGNTRSQVCGGVLLSITEHVQFLFCEWSKENLNYDLINISQIKHNIYCSYKISLENHMNFF